MRTNIGKWGNSLAVRVPAVIAETVALYDGASVDLSVVDGAIVVRPLQHKRNRKDIRQIVAEMDPRTFPDESFETSPLGEELI
jgi:antitoxin MazE